MLISLFILGITCLLVQAAPGDHCGSGADCPANECCVTRNRPLGKRQLLLGATCQPMGTSGSGCFVRDPSGKPSHTVFGCPCIAGLTCHGTGMFDVPLGEVGKCG